MKKMNKFRKYSMIPMLAAAVLLTGCEKEEDEIPEWLVLGFKLKIKQFQVKLFLNSMIRLDFHLI